MALLRSLVLLCGCVASVNAARLADRRSGGAAVPPASADAPATSKAGGAGIGVDIGIGIGGLIVDGGDGDEERAGADGDVVEAGEEALLALPRLRPDWLEALDLVTQLGEGAFGTVSRYAVKQNVSSDLSSSKAKTVAVKEFHYKLPAEFFSLGTSGRGEGRSPGSGGPGLVGGSSSVGAAAGSRSVAGGVADGRSRTGAAGAPGLVSFSSVGAVGGSRSVVSAASSGLGPYGDIAGGAFSFASESGRGSDEDTERLIEWLDTSDAEVGALVRLRDDPHFVEIYADEGVTTFSLGRLTRRFVMEDMRGGNLDDFLPKLRVLDFTRRLGVALRLLLQLLGAVEAMQRLELMHRDLKPENILLAPGCDPALDPGNCAIKVADFGFACSMRPVDWSIRRCELDTRSVGTMSFMAPERWGSDWDQWPKRDLFSVGAIFFELACSEERLRRSKPLWEQLGASPCPAKPLAFSSRHPVMDGDLDFLLRHLLWPSPKLRWSAWKAAEAARAMLDEVSAAEAPGGATAPAPAARRSAAALPTELMATT